MISVVLLGAGNVGEHFYKAIKSSKELDCLQWYNKSLSRLSSYENEVAITDDIKDLAEADIYIIAVSDDAIGLLSSSLDFEKRLVVHTSGSSSIHDLDKKLYRGVLYPLQSFSASRPMDFSKVPLCIEALDKNHYAILNKVGTSLGSPIYKINTDQRKILHLSAVFVNNFGNQLFRIAHELSDAKNINFDILKPLIAETAEKIQNMSPYMAQTGPALRGDKKTIKRHLKALENSPHKAVYELLTQSIQKTHGRR
jgi:predicted short-subunit dehydrogenase-like oxidoreductase (DUF2520 family)